MFKKKILLFLLVLLLFVIVLYLLSQYLSKGTPFKGNRNQYIGEYKNHDAFFNLSYPEELNLYQVTRSGTFDPAAEFTRGFPSALRLLGKIPEFQNYGHVGFCVGEVDFENRGCINGGFSILYGVPDISGKGGRCPGDYGEIKVGGQEASACYSEGAFLVTYPRHPQGISELNIYAMYSEEFSEEAAREILESIEFIVKP